MNNNEVQEHRRERLEAASTKAGGKAALGRLLGYKDGAFVGQMLRGARPITEKTVEELESKQGFKGWFRLTTFSDTLTARIATLEEPDFKALENVMRAHLRMGSLESDASFLETTAAKTAAQKSSAGRKSDDRNTRLPQNKAA